MKGSLLELSNHKFSSNVIEKCVQQASEKDRQDFIEEILEGNEELKNNTLYQMIQDKYGNYVI